MSSQKRKNKNKDVRRIVFYSASIFLLLTVFLFRENLVQIIPPNWNIFEKNRISNFGVRIDKIDVLIPIIENVDGENEKIYLKSLKKGVAHYKGSSFPGQSGNIFIFGHSSTETGSGRYAKIFERLGEIEKGDKISIYYKGDEYFYNVFEKSVVAANNMSVLKQTEEEQLTLMTCWPIGTDKKRMIIKASR